MQHPLVFLIKILLLAWLSTHSLFAQKVLSQFDHYFKDAGLKGSFSHL